MKTQGADAFGVCPITNEPFVDPVVDHEGNTYEKKAIEEWLEHNSTSPITRNPLTVDQLFPNRALKSLIAESQEEEGSTKSVNTSPTVSDDEPDFENQDALMELAKTTRVQSIISGPDGLGAVKIIVPDDKSERRLPASIICVIDESYSMDDAATTQEDQEGNSGLSLMDIVKHATKTVIEILGPEDSLAIITYADNATLRLPFLKMTRANKSKATSVVNEFKTRGSTNLWDGLNQAMELANKMSQTTDVFLLTDGVPNIHPPRGELETFTRYKAKTPKCNYRISTFGFGYSLDSKLLNDIAIEGDGQFFFIPDSAFVGTVFINATSFVVSTAIGKSTLVFDENGLARIQMNEEEGETMPQQHQTKPLPSLSFGHTLDLIVEKDGHGAGINWEAPTNSLDWDVPRLRYAMVEMIRRAEDRFIKKEANALKVAQEEITKLVAEFDMALGQSGNSESDSHAILKALREDLTGQITEAYSRADWHSRWGRHYLLSLARAHELQRCTNFKDPGLQIYATSKFGMIRDEAEEIFCGIPPPTPSRRVDSSRFRPVASMSTYYNAAAGCLARGNVRMADGRFVPLSSVNPGDTLQIGSSTVKVRCVVTTECYNGVEELVELEGGVLVTPWHPIRKKGSLKWEFPANLGTAKLYSCKMVYNFVLDNDFAVPLGPYEAITLGHGICTDPVAKHEYFGSTKVIQDLQLMFGWNQGRVHLGTNPGRRDPETGLVSGFVQNINILESKGAVNSEALSGHQVLRADRVSA